MSTPNDFELNCTSKAFEYAESLGSTLLAAEFKRLRGAGWGEGKLLYWTSNFEWVWYSDLSLIRYSHPTCLWLFSAVIGGRAVNKTGPELEDVFIGPP